jgi:hypothetical protein
MRGCRNQTNPNEWSNNIQSPMILCLIQSPPSFQKSLIIIIIIINFVLFWFSTIILTTQNDNLNAFTHHATCPQQAKTSLICQHHTSTTCHPEPCLPGALFLPMLRCRLCESRNIFLEKVRWKVNREKGELGGSVTSVVCSLCKVKKHGSYLFIYF